MNYLLTFLEGLASFISPCILPVVPLYVSYIAPDTDNRKKTVLRAIGFSLGLLVFFVIAGAFAGTIGKLLINARLFFRVFTGIILIILGLMVMEVIPHFSPAFGLDIKVSGFFSSFVLGFLFAINMTPCIGPLFGSALVMASKEGSILKGMILLLIYGVGMVIPFLLVALLADYVRKTFEHLDNVMSYLKYVFGAIIIITGILVIAGVI